MYIDMVLQHYRSEKPWTSSRLGGVMMDALSKTTIRKSGRKGGALNMCASEKIVEEGNAKRVAIFYFFTPWDCWRKCQQATNN